MSKAFLVLPPRVCSKCGAKSEPGQDGTPVYFSFGLGVTSNIECRRGCNPCGHNEKVEMVTASTVVEVSGRKCPLFDTDAGICVVSTGVCRCGSGDPGCPLSRGPAVIFKKD